MVWIINKAAFFARSTQNGSSMVMVTMLSMDPTIEASFASIFNGRWSALTIGSEAGRHSSLGSKYIWGDYRFVASHDVSKRRSFTRSISASLMVVYSASEGVVPKGRCRQRKASFLKLKCMLTLSVHLRGRVSMQH